jgi:hypothetical protein
VAGCTSIVGVVVVVAGFAVMTGATWARLAGICMAGLSVILNIAFLAEYPFWVLTIIAGRPRHLRARGGGPAAEGVVSVYQAERK